MVSAIQDRGIHFHRVSPDGTCRLRQKLYCPETGKEYNFSEAARGYEIAPHEYVIVDEEELEALEPQSGHTVDIVEFVKLAEIDPLYFDRPYFLVPDGKSTKPYELFRQVLEDEDKVAIAKVIMRDKEYLVALRANDRVLMLQTLHYQEEVISPRAVAEQPDVKISAQEKKLAAALIDSLSSEFNPEEFVNETKEKLQSLLEKKSRGERIRVKPEVVAAEHPKVVDLMSRLKASLKQSETIGNAASRANGTNGQRKSGGRGRSREQHAH